MPGAEQPKTRRRALTYLPGKSTSRRRNYTGNPPVLISDVTVQGTDLIKKVPGTQVTVSEGHAWPPRKNEKFQDRGGNFFTEKRYVENLDVVKHVRVDDRNSQGAGITLDYEGPIHPIDYNSNTMSYPPAVPMSDSDMDLWGTRAVERCSPTNSAADLSTFLGEILKDGLPSLVGSQLWQKGTKSLLGKAASEYLNVQFGWKPIVNDGKKFLSAVSKADKILAQFERDAGRMVRRQYRFPPTKSRSEVIVQEGNHRARIYTPHASFYGLTLPASSRVVATTETSQRMWFSGAFTYDLPRGYDSRGKVNKYAAIAEHVLGTHITPETLWNVAPWSWAADWFGSVGSVVSYTSDAAKYGLVMPYGYLMVHTITKRTYTIDHPRLKGVASVSPLSFVVETKQRRKANPYGFGVSWDDLSPYQLSIVAALGLSRSS